MAFGLVGLLVTAAVIVWVFAQTQTPVLQQGMKAQDKIRPLAGQDEDGNKARDTITLEPMSEGGKLVGILVTDVQAGGAMENKFGLRKNDLIVKIGRRGGLIDEVKVIGDDEMAVALVHEAFNFDLSLVVSRDGERVQLPDSGGASNTPGVPAKPKSSINSQLDAIQRVPTH